MKDSFLFVPAKGRIVRDPISGEIVPSEGRLVPNTAHWIRRIQDGDGTQRVSKSKKSEG